MIISKFIDFINKEYGVSIDASYYTYIDGWKCWYDNYDETFHKYSETALDGARHVRTMFRLSMAKTVCEDWASMLLNDKTTITIDDPIGNAWLLGDEGTAGLLQKLDFWNQSNRLVELMMRSGTAAWVISLENLPVSQDGRVIRDPNTKIALDYLPAECILPITVRHGKIIECAFASETYQGGHAVIYLQVHRLAADGTYTITNRYYQGDSNSAEDGGYTEIPLPSGIAPVVYTGSRIPWFSVITPNIVRNLPNTAANGLGMSIFANAIDALKMVDIAFNNYSRDLRLGGKKLFYNKKLIKTYVDSDGTPHQVAPDDVQQQLFWVDGTGDPDAKTDVYDYNPSLRTDQNRMAVQDALNYLSMKVGLGGHYYVFEHDAVSTATQYIGDKKTLINSIDRHQITIEAGLIQIIKAMLACGADILGIPLDPSANIRVSWDASFVKDESAERESMRRDVAMHLIPAYAYVEKYYNLSREDAIRMTAEAAEPEITPLEVSQYGNAG